MNIIVEQWAQFDPSTIKIFGELEGCPMSLSFRIWDIVPNLSFLNQHLNDTNI